MMIRLFSVLWLLALAGCPEPNPSGLDATADIVVDVTGDGAADAAADLEDDVPADVDDADIAPDADADAAPDADTEADVDADAVPDADADAAPDGDAVPDVDGDAASDADADAVPDADADAEPDVFDADAGCPPGWQGDDCTEDVDECVDAGTCAPNQGCFNLPGSFECEAAVFVDAAADPQASDGLTWETAFVHPSDALATGARVVWVKAGDYTLGQGEYVDVPVEARLYGGFSPDLAGTSGNVALRELSVNVSQLAGHPLTSGGLVRVASEARVDGFTITEQGGLLDVAGGGVVVDAVQNVVLANLVLSAQRAVVGAGVACSDASLTMLDVAIQDGASLADGAGIWASNCTVEATNLTVDGNRSYLHGGGLYVSGGAFSIDGGVVSNNEVAPTVIGCPLVDTCGSNGPFAGVLAARGGGMTAVGATVDLSDVVFHANLAQGQDSGGFLDAVGGGIYYDGPDATWSGLTFSNNTAAGGSGANCGLGYGGGLYVASGTISLPSLVITDNQASSGGTTCPPPDGGGGYAPPATAAIISDANGENVAGNAPNVWGPCPDGFCDCSLGPCVNGSCTDLNPGFQCDCDPFWGGIYCEQDTDVDDCDGVVCANADEVCVDGLGVASCEPVVMVVPGAAPGGDGVTWETAFSTIEDALAAGATALWVAQGSYQPSAPIALTEAVVIMGGFPSGLTGRDGDPAARGVDDRTGLDGNHAVGPLVIVNAGGITLDGLELFNGVAVRGAGLRVVDANRTTLLNLLIRDNTAAGDGARGGGFDCDNALDIEITGGAVQNNTITNLGPTPAWGGGAALLGCTGLIDGWTVAANSAMSPVVLHGGGVAIVGGSVDLTNVSVLANQAVGVVTPCNPVDSTASDVCVGAAGADALGGGLYVDTVEPMTWSGLTTAANLAFGGPGMPAPPPLARYCQLYLPNPLVTWQCFAVGGALDGSGTAISPIYVDVLPCAGASAGGPGGAGLGGGMFTTMGVPLVLDGATVSDNTALGGAGGPPAASYINQYNCACSNPFNGTVTPMTQGCVDLGWVFCSGPFEQCDYTNEGPIGWAEGGGLYTAAAPLQLTSVTYGTNGPNNIAPCPVDTTGPDCSQLIDDCASAPCQNGGTCNDGVGAFTCDCPAGYIGETCEAFDCAVLDCTDPCGLGSCSAEFGCDIVPLDCDDGLACSVDTCLVQTPLCPAGAKLVGDRCYSFTPTAPLDWLASKAFCESAGGHLVTLETAAENAKIAEGFVTSGGAGDCFISTVFPVGLSDAAVEGTFEWVTGELPTFTGWFPVGEPDMTPDNEADYVYAYGGQPYWFDDLATSSFAPNGCTVCEFPVGTATGNCSHDTSGCP